MLGKININHTLGRHQSFLTFYLSTKEEEEVAFTVSDNKELESCEERRVIRLDYLNELQGKEELVCLL